MKSTCFLLTKGKGWNHVNILNRNEENPGLGSDYSLLEKANYIKNQSSADYFEVLPAFSFHSNLHFLFLALYTVYDI